MMAGNPSWWSMQHPPSQHHSALLTPVSPFLFPPQYVLGSSTSLPPNSLPVNQELPVQSWSQLHLGGLSVEEERFGPSHYQPKKFENLESQILNPSSLRVPVVVDVKQEVKVTQNKNLYGLVDDEFQAYTPAAAWSQIMPVSSPRSCITNISSNMLDFASNKATDHKTTVTRPGLDPSSECNSVASGGACKKARVQPSSSQPPLKARKEKLGDKISTLHQLVSPFGKTDTASVLLEVTGYIRFLQDQIEALSSPYLGTASPNMRNQQSVQGEGNCAFPDKQGQDKPKDLRSRGLCLVPVSCTIHQVESDNGADSWAPAFGGGF